MVLDMILKFPLHYRRRQNRMIRRFDFVIPALVAGVCALGHILNTPNRVSGIGAFNAAHTSANLHKKAPRQTPRSLQACEPLGLSSCCVSPIANRQCRCRSLFCSGSCIHSVARPLERRRRQGRPRKRLDPVPGCAGWWSWSLHRRTRQPKKARCQPPRLRFCSKSSSLPPISLARGHAQTTRNAVGGSVQKASYARVPSKTGASKVFEGAWATSAINRCALSPATLRKRRDVQGPRRSDKNCLRKCIFKWTDGAFRRAGKSPY